MKNEPAFPCTTLNELGDEYAENPGLTKREYFAGLAMQAYCISAGETAVDPTGHSEERLAENAIVQADALIKELEK